MRFRMLASSSAFVAFVFVIVVDSFSFRPFKVSFSTDQDRVSIVSSSRGRVHRTQFHELRWY